MKTRSKLSRPWSLIVLPDIGLIRVNLPVERKKNWLLPKFPFFLLYLWALLVSKKYKFLKPCRTYLNKSPLRRSFLNCFFFTKTDYPDKKNLKIK
jgi:hypothetical protein